MKKLLYIDPQSYANLALYDYNLLKGMDLNIVYCCRCTYNAPIIPRVNYQFIFSYDKKRNPILKGLSYINSLLHILIIAYKFKPDIIHIQWWRIWFLDYLLLKLLKIKFNNIVYTAHNVVPHDSGDKYKSKCLKYYNAVDKIIVHSENTKNELIEDFNVIPFKIEIIPHGILSLNVVSENVNSIADAISQKFQLKQKIVFTLLGNQSVYKGTDIAYDAFISSSILKNNPNIQLFIIGKGNIVQNDINIYQNIYCNNVSVSDEQFCAYMRVTDVLLLPYRRISQSGVLLTAIDYQIPYIATDIGGLTEPLSIANIGWKIKNTDISELRELMEYLVTHKDMIDSIKNDETLWDKVKKYYSWQDISEKTVFFYNS